MNKPKEQESIPENLAVLIELTRNSALCKYAHFSAADRNKDMRSWFGAPVVVINVALGSIFFFSLSQELPQTAKWIGALLALLAASLAALHTYFNFNRAFEAHRTIGNKYNSLFRECEYTKAQYKDSIIDLAALSETVSVLIRRYNDINGSSEPFPTNTNDFQSALKQEKMREDHKSKHEEKAVEELKQYSHNKAN